MSSLSVIAVLASIGSARCAMVSKDGSVRLGSSWPAMISLARPRPLFFSFGVNVFTDLTLAVFAATYTGLKP